MFVITGFEAIKLGIHLLVSIQVLYSNGL